VLVKCSFLAENCGTDKIRPRGALDIQCLPHYQLSASDKADIKVSPGNNL